MWTVFLGGGRWSLAHCYTLQSLEVQYFLNKGMNGIPLLKKQMFLVENSCRFGSEVTGASFPR